MVSLFKLLGWASIAFGFLLFVIAGQQLRSNDIGRCVVATLAGIGACYWGYLMARPVARDPDEWEDEKDSFLPERSRPDVSAKPDEESEPGWTRYTLPVNRKDRPFHIEDPPLPSPQGHSTLRRVIFRVGAILFVVCLFIAVMWLSIPEGTFPRYR